MTQSEAKRLIENAHFEGKQPEKWADLGCGSGLFSYALAELLPRESEILMVDKVNQAPFNSPFAGVHLDFLQIDFTVQDLPSSELDGILMANSLHYVQHKKPFIQKLKNYLSDQGQMIIIEYDTKQSNPWIPYPITLKRLKELFLEEGFIKVRKIGERPSRYGHKNMFACEVK